MINDILICECSSMEHQIVVSYNEDDNIVYCLIYLNNFPFWKRLRAGIKYIFGYKCKYGNFEEFIFSPQHVDKIEKIKEILSK